MSQTAIKCSLMRGGTSKGLFFLREDLPPKTADLHRALLAAMGSPDPRQIDGAGGGHPLTSKVAVVSRSDRPNADVNYLFLQVWPDRHEVSSTQNCGNMLAAVAPFAIEQGLVPARDGTTPVRIWMENTDTLATARVLTPNRQVRYDGDCHIDGVHGTHAPIPIEFADTAGSSCGALLPTGNPTDEIDGTQVTCIDNGMPVVCLSARDFTLTGHETPGEIEAMAEMKSRIESIRLRAGRLMNLGDVTSSTVPKMSLLSPASDAGTVCTRTLIPHRVHDAIGVLGAISVATACLVPGSVAARIAHLQHDSDGTDVVVEHPTGAFTVNFQGALTPDLRTAPRAALLRTARLLLRGEVLVPQSVWEAT